MKRHPGHKPPDIIFINFSAMDFMFNESVEHFEGHLHEFYGQLTKTYPTSIVVANLLVDVVSSMSSSLNEIAVPGNALLKPMTCAQNYEQVGFGSLIGIKKGVDEEHLARLSEKLTAMNDKISSELAAINARIYPYNEFGGKAIEVALNLPPSENFRDYLAADCIHPNIMGQKLYSDLLWDAVRDEITP